MSIWQDKFGDEYQERNPASYTEVAKRTAIWKKIIPKVSKEDTSSIMYNPPSSILEIGAGQGSNLYALKDLWNNRFMWYTNLYYTEVNKKQIDKLETEGFILYLPDSKKKFFDLVFTYGVLIHTPPAELDAMFQKMYDLSEKYVVFCEYYRPELEDLEYRGMKGEMWGNDFGKLFKAKFPSAKCIDCGFMWKETTGLDNVTYWIFVK
jgi:pseudaminic acid biosynthesis-associated methylase